MTNDIRVLCHDYVYLAKKKNGYKWKQKLSWTRAKGGDDLECLNLGEGPICEYVDLDKSFNEYAFFKNKNGQIRQNSVEIKIL